MRRLSIPHCRCIHFVGIGGAGMSPIAKILVQMGYRVQGSDIKESIKTIRLKDMGVKVFYDHKIAHLRAADIVVASTAIDHDNVELVQAREEKIPVYRRSEMLDCIMKEFPHRIAVAGAHGKTTTTAMMAVLLDSEGFRPTYVVGADVNNFHNSSRLGDGDFVVAEADESDGSFLCLSANLGIILNVDDDHMDYFQTMDNMVRHYNEFVDRVVDNQGGRVVLNRDDAVLNEIRKRLTKKQYVDFSLKDPKAYVYATQVQHSQKGTGFHVSIKGKDEGEFKLKLHGLQYVYDACSVIAACSKMGIATADIKHGLNQFLGTKRRFQKIGEVDGITVLDDYAHHPTEISVTLDAIKKSFNNRLICVFQAHRYSRFKALEARFIESFEPADCIVVTNIFASGEIIDKSICIKKFCEDIRKRYPQKDVYYVPQKSRVPQEIEPYLKKGDYLVTMGAGDIHSICLELINRLKKRNKPTQGAVS